MREIITRRWQLPCLLVLHALVFMLLVSADPAEIHSAEILQPASVAVEFNRGAIAFADMPLYLNGLITIWETLAFAGLFRLFGVSLIPLICYAAIVALLTTAAWHAVLHRAFGMRTARWGCLFFIAGTPWWWAISTQFDSRHTTANALLPLLLLCFHNWVLAGSFLGTLLFAAIAVFAVVLTRATWLLLFVLFLAAGTRLPRQTLLPLGLGAASALLLRHVIPPAMSINGIFRQYETPLWDMLTQPAPFTSISQLLVAVFTNYLPQTLGFAPLVATCYLLVALAAACLLAFRTTCRHAFTPRFIVRVMVGYPLIFLTALVYLGFKGHFHDDHAPGWFAFRYLTSFMPLCAVAIGVALATFPVLVRRGALLTLLIFLGHSLADWHYLHRPLATYRAVNYRITGEMIARALRPDNIAWWRPRLLRLSAEAMPALVSGLGTMPAVPELPPEQLQYARELVPPGYEKHFYRSAGYWAGYGSPEKTEIILRHFVPPEWRADFCFGLSLPHNRQEWWPIYHAARGTFREPFPVIVD